MAIGAAAALLMTPAVYAIQSVAVRIWKSQHASGRADGAR